MVWWHVVVVLALWGGLMLGVGLAYGREKLRDLRQQVEAAYDNGWDDSALAHTAPLSTGRGAAGDGPAPLPASPMMCPGGSRCVRGPEPHQWSPDCEEDEGWTDAFDPEVGALPTAAEREAMLAELAPESERPASHTDQFNAVFSRSDPLERQYLLTWDSARRYERTRPAYLREMGISEARIRELLGAE
jgi:hypothetical protein